MALKKGVTISRHGLATFFDTFSLAFSWRKSVLLLFAWGLRMWVCRFPEHTGPLASAVNQSDNGCATWVQKIAEVFYSLPAKSAAGPIQFVTSPVGLTSRKITRRILILLMMHSLLRRVPIKLKAFLWRFACQSGMWRKEQPAKLNVARTCKKHTGHRMGNGKILNRTAALSSCFSMLIDFAALFTQIQASFSALAFVLRAMQTLNVEIRQSV